MEKIRQWCCKDKRDTQISKFKIDVLRIAPFDIFIPVWMMFIYFTVSATVVHCDKLDDCCQINWFTLSLLRATDRNDRVQYYIQPITYHHSEQVHEQRLEPMSNGY